MNCHACGTALAPTARFCHKCGAQVGGTQASGWRALPAGEATAAPPKADTIRRAAPTHLFAFMLRARALELRHDTAGALRAYREFLVHEAAERARQRPEYADHAENLDGFHGQATAATRGRGDARGR